MARRRGFGIRQLVSYISGLIFRGKSETQAIAALEADPTVTATFSSSAITQAAGLALLAVGNAQRAGQLPLGSPLSNVLHGADPPFSTVRIYFRVEFTDPSGGKKWRMFAVDTGWDATYAEILAQLAPMISLHADDYSANEVTGVEITPPLLYPNPRV